MSEDKKMVPSPCIRICRIDEEKQVCIGCLRTLNEIASWGSYTEAEKLRVYEHISNRKKSYPVA
ncbi:MAG: DUF1289 domain-containing protein [Calditrichota bacterium]|mgnify:CR=1 FL=1